MSSKTTLHVQLAVVLVFTLAGCDHQVADLTAPELTAQLDAAAKTSTVTAQAEDFTDLKAMVDGINARLETAGSDLRLEYPWLFRVGPGTDPFARLRTGARWIDPAGVTYVYDASDATQDVDPAVLEVSVVNGFEGWNGIRTSSLHLRRIADSGGNFDVLDGILRDANGECVDVLDLTSPNLVFNSDGVPVGVDPEADVVFGGWLSDEYFQDCLGSSAILGVTWSFQFGDANGDNYTDQVYSEMFYNEGFDWLTSGAMFLGPGEDVESIVLHEVGHAVGLDHFGGPVRLQPLRLQPNGSVFNPEAVMNPFYLGGEKRALYATDAAAIMTLYGRG
jgi:hypothetical protein